MNFFFVRRPVIMFILQTCCILALHSVPVLVPVPVPSPLYFNKSAVSSHSTETSHFPFDIQIILSSLHRYHAISIATAIATHESGTISQINIKKNEDTERESER